MDGQLNLVDVACRKRGAACTGGFLSDFERVDPNSRNLLARATDRLILGGGGSPLPLPSSVQLLPAARVRGWPQADRPRCPATVMKLSEKKKRWAGMVSRVGWTQWECEWNVNRRVEKEGEGGGETLFFVLTSETFKWFNFNGCTLRVSVGSDPSYGFGETFFRGKVRRMGVLLKGGLVEIFLGIGGGWYFDRIISNTNRGGVICDGFFYVDFGNFFWMDIFFLIIFL